MSKGIVKAIGFVAGAVAVVASGGAALGLGLALGGAVIPAATIAAGATLIAGVANIGLQLTANTRAPPARGSITQILIQPNAPQPYLMGESYSAGVLRHDVGYGATLNKVPNPYRGMVVVYSGGGPLQELVSLQTDFAPVSSWFSGYLATDSQLGAKPESDALSPPFGAMPGWGSSYKLSGQAAVLWNFKFDKDGKRFASGLPVFGAVWKGVKVYDPRLDSTYPGGSGSHRVNDEATWAYSDNPALHAVAYVYGRHQNGTRTLGVGLPVTGIDLASAAAWANVCDANNWRISGSIYEPGDRWANLKDICAAGGAQPVFAGGVLSFKVSAPTVALNTITEAHLTDDAVEVTAMQSWRDRLNTIVPKYRSPAHNWEMVAAEAVSVPTYLTEDGEERVEEWPFNLVRDADQAAELGTYKLVDGRELIATVTCGPRMFAYRPGECLHVDLPQSGLDHDMIIVGRKIDPARMTITFTLMSETVEKHDYALGRTTTPPPTPTLTQSSEDRDKLAWDRRAWWQVGDRTAEVINAELDDLSDAIAASVTVEMSRPAATLYAYANGGVVDWLPASGKVTARLRDGTDVTASTAISFSASSGVTGSVDSNGNYAVTAMTGQTGTLTIQLVYGGVTYTKLFTVTKAVAGYEIVSALPATNLFIGRRVFLDTDEKLYTYLTSGWTKTVPAADVSGQITSTQIANDAITTPKLAANAVTADEIATDAVTTNKINAGAITAAKLATTELITVSAQIGDGVITNAKIGDLEVDSAKIANLTVGDEKIVPGAASAGSSFFHVFFYTIAAGSEQDIANGGFTCQTSVTPAAEGAQLVMIRMAITMNRNGSNDDAVTVKCLREDGTYLPETYTYDVQGQNWVYYSQFTDTNPSGATRTYRPRIQSNDQTLIKAVSMQTSLAKR